MLTEELLPQRRGGAQTNELKSVLCGSMILCAYVVNLRKSGKGYNLIGVNLPHRHIGS